MILRGTVGTKMSDKGMQGGDDLKTLECLRGRLLAERGASRAANEEAKQMGNKLTELENQLSKEVKSRNRAEKRLKSLIKKLESMNISFMFEFSYESSSDQSSSFEKIEFNSVSSSSSSSTVYTNSYPKALEDDKAYHIETRIKDTTKSEVEEPVKDEQSPLSENLKHNVAYTNGNSHIVPSDINTRSGQSVPKKFNDSQCAENKNDPNHRLKYEAEAKDTNGEKYPDEGGGSVVDSMALVTTENVVLDQAIESATVEDVVHSLKPVKERLKTSMQQRHKIRVGFR